MNDIVIISKCCEADSYDFDTPFYSELLAGGHRYRRMFAAVIEKIDWLRENLPSTDLAIVSQLQDGPSPFQSHRMRYVGIVATFSSDADRIQYKLMFDE